MSEIRATEYTEFLIDIKSRIRQRQYQAFRAVNTEMVALYWDIGESIDRKQKKIGWGKAVHQQCEQYATNQGILKIFAYLLLQSTPQERR